MGAASRTREVETRRESRVVWRRTRPPIPLVELGASNLHGRANAAKSLLANTDIEIQLLTFGEDTRGIELENWHCACVQHTFA